VAPNGRRCQDDDEDAFPTTHKMEFPKYDGTSDPLPWLNVCERYFYIWRTPKLRRITYTSIYLTNYVELWYH
jgi:hypothetical protein